MTPSSSYSPKPAKVTLLAPVALTASNDAYLDAIPAYMTEVYDWAYGKPRWVCFLDQNWMVRVLLFGNDQRLFGAYLADISPGMRVWQLAHVYGDLVQSAARRVGPKGQFHMTDVMPIQVERARHKLQGLPWASVIRADAASFAGQGQSHYDLICSFFLLHEVPDEKKRQIVNRMLSAMPAGGKCVFVDYHRPAWWQPVRWIMKAVNRYLEPFANALWRNEISSYASQPEQFVWQKRTLFGGMYQHVVVTHRLPH